MTKNTLFFSSGIGFYPKFLQFPDGFPVIFEISGYLAGEVAPIARTRKAAPVSVANWPRPKPTKINI